MHQAIVAGVAWFEKRRGLALGIALSGFGVGAALVPAAAQWMIGLWGWREACLVFGGLILLITLPLAAFVLREKQSDLGVLPDGVTPKSPATSPSAAMAAVGGVAPQAPTEAGAYVTGSPVKGLGGWDWGERSPFARCACGEPISALLEKNPDARVLVSAGYYDTMTTTDASQYLVDQAEWPRDRVRLEYYVGGHMAYSDEDTARRLAADLRQLME